MFIDLFLAVVVGVVFLWLPGILLLLSIRLDKLIAVSFAPIISTLLYAILGFVYGQIDVFSTWLNVVLPVLAVTIVVFVVSKIVRAKNGFRYELLIPKERAHEANKPFRYKRVIVFALYIMCGIAATCLIFVSGLSNPDSVLQAFDNVHHLGVVRTFVETGQWSFLHVAAYGGIPEDMQAIQGWNFYPTIWHMVGAILVSAVGVPVALAANATNILFVAFVFPAGMFSLLEILFGKFSKAHMLGCILSFAFAAFPWKFLVWGPLFPNLASYALMAPVIFMFLILFETKRSRYERALATILFVLGSICLVLAQTNAVFTMAVFLIPFVIMQASRIPLLLKGDKCALWHRLICAGLSIVVISAIWCLLYETPFLHEVVSHVWPPFEGKRQALINVAMLSFNGTQPQIVLGFLVVVGIFASFVYRKLRWVTVAYVMMCIIYIVCAASEGIIKQVLGGFWYTDTMRLAASAALYAIPLACLGLTTLLSLISKFVLSVASRRQNVEKISNAAQATVALIFIIAVFSPVSFISTLMGVRPALLDIHETVKAVYDSKAPNVYDADERSFVQKTLDITGDDIVLNMPDDGSAFAYGIDGLNVFYRYTRTYGNEDEIEISKIIRENLNNVSTDLSVQKAVEQTGAQYLIKLDQDDQYIRQSPYLFTYDESLWEGVDGVNDDTPGFEIVLSEGDMRLYRIADI
ncbi:DUF6541 family protein [Adlercreutzia sp. ZJ304]|uniref:DUF6541 family protein n=1 Tax=Adlercreutzia sp. ZJ304 TaxID=2709791 RepID=UPI0013ECD73D|nr:DUF6541 family protein [Adlercreutzia sp. ZJ304]